MDEIGITILALKISYIKIKHLIIDSFIGKVQYDKDKKNLLYVIIGILVITIFIMGIIITNNTKNDKSSISIPIEYGDYFPDIKITSINGDSFDFINDIHEYKIVFYVDKYCSSCLDSLNIVERFTKIYKSSKINYYILWNGEYSLSHIEKYNLKKENNIILHNDYELAISKPSFFILNKDNNIIFTDVSYENLVDKISQYNIFSSNDLIENSNKFLINKYFLSSTKIPLIYFSMEDCPDCIESNKIINTENIKSKFDIVTIYYKNIKNSSDKIVDYGNLFLKIYNIEWYPSFLLINNEDYNFIGKTFPEDLEKILINYKN